MMSDMFLSDANNSLNRVVKYQNQVDSTKKISNISEDPQATMIALRARNRLSSINTYKENIQTVKSYLNEAESAADALNELMQSTYEEVVSAISGIKNESDLAITADLIANYKKEAVTIGNTAMGTSYLFGGYNFSGTTDGINTTQPFSIDETSGHLIYNGIDLSRISYAEDYDKNLELITTFTGEISAKNTELYSTSSDGYARDDICKAALNSLNSLIDSGKEALSSAKNFGIDESSAEYQNLSKLIYGSGTEGESGYTAGLEKYSKELTNECSKELSQNTASNENAFSVDKAKNILGSINELIYNTDSASGFSYSVNDAFSALQDKIDGVLTSSGSLTALADEADNRAQLQVGIRHSESYSFAGTDLLGNGTDNIYYILDKCEKMLRSGDSKGLAKIVSEVQSAQNRVLSFEAGIGTAINGMDMLGSRYESSVFNYSEMQSLAIDADMAEAITNLTTAQTVYNATLAGGAELMRTSLLDFLS
jgi:flagellar hook-associated protein 3